MGYVKTIDLSMLRGSDMAILKDSIDKMGFSNKDYRIVEYGSDGVELKIMSPFLHRILKVMRKTQYTKRRNGGKDDTKRVRRSAQGHRREAQ